MSYLNFKSEYDRFPKTKIKNHKAFHGYDAIYQELNKKIMHLPEAYRSLSRPSSPP